ncbi:ninein-like protein [Littorina saxatilis]
MQLLKTSAEMAAGQTQLVREVEHLKQKAGNMVELETFTGLQVSLLETQRHAISLQEALMQRTQLADRIMGEAEKERRQERDAWEEQKREIQSRLDATMEMYRSLALQHKALRQSTTKLATQMKDLYVENANLMSVLQQTEAKQIAAQRKNRKLQRQCQAWHDTVHRMLHKKQDALGQTW